MRLPLYFQPRLIAILLLGFASGLPLALTASTLGAWLTESNISISTIGVFAAVSTPYALKFLWSPLVDGLPIPFFSQRFGRRRGWLLMTQLLLIFAIILLGLCNPTLDLSATALAAFGVALLSATQDIVIDAYRVELLPPEEQGAGAAAIVLGYRFGMITSTAGALFLASYYSWQITYVVMAGLLSVGIIAAWIAGEPQTTQTGSSSYGGGIIVWLKEHIIAPFADFMTRDHWLGVLAFILLYKLGDAFLGVMTNPFLLKLGFTKTTIASIVKLYGLVATIAGAFVGGWLVYRIGLMRTLFLCGIFHALTNLMFLWQASAGADSTVLAFSITLENLSSGMGTAAFVAFMSRLCHKEFTATQYALLSSLSAFGRTWLSTPAGWVAETLGWEMFFLFCVFLAVPGLIMLWWLGKKNVIPGEA